MTNIARYKQIYELWVKYLAKSPRYQRFCADQRDQEPSSIFRHKRIEQRRFNRGYWNIRDVYEFFGDIHSAAYTFENWWDNTMLPLLTERSSTVRAIAKVDKRLDQYVTEIKKELLSLPREANRTVIAKKVEKLLNDFFWSKAGTLLLQLRTCSSETLEAKLASVMRDETETRAMMARPTSLLFPMLTPYKLLNDEDIRAFERYLKVYEYRHQEPKLKYKEIAELLAVDEDREWDGTIVYYKISNHITDNTFATRIIKNTERGLFPGTYHKKRSKKKR